MLRPPTVATGLIAAPGWLAATAPYAGLAALVGAVMAGRAIANLVNDLLDEEKDRTTAPELPLPSGLVTRPVAIGTALALVALQLALVWIATEGRDTFLLGVGGCAACGGLVGLYSLVKPYAGAAMVVTGLAYMSCPVTAWLVAGGSWSTEVGLVFLYGFLRGVGANVFSTYRDVDRDGGVGNRSVAVRLGAERAFALGVLVEAMAVVCVFGVAVVRDEVLLGAAVLVVSLALFAFAWRATVRRRAASATGEDRDLLILPVRVARNHAAIVIVQSLALGLVAVGVTVTCFALETLYTRRIIKGGLRRSLGGSTTPEATRVLVGDVG